MACYSASFQAELTLVREHPLLQRGWEMTLAGLLVGLFLLSARLLGSLVPDPDVWRAWGTVALIQGSFLFGYWWLTGRAAGGRCSVRHVLGWSLAQLAALGSLSLALAPVNAVIPLLLSLAGLLATGLLYGQIMLDYLDVAAGFPDEELSARPVAVDAKVAADTPPLNAAGLSAEAALTSGAGEAGFPGSDESNRQQLLQWQTRRQEADGTEVIEGMIQLQLAAGQTHRSAHVAFTPALPVAPQLECEPLTDGDFETFLGDVYPHGFRVELRRTQGPSPTEETVEIGFLASCLSRKSNAA